MRADLARAFLDGDELVGVNFGKRVDLAAGPADFDGVSYGVRAEPKRQHQLARRKIARAAAQHFILSDGGSGRRSAGGGHANRGADAIAIRLRADEFDAQAVIVRADVVEE